MANILPITSFSAPELDVFARLTENQLVNRSRPRKRNVHCGKPARYGRAI